MSAFAVATPGAASGGHKVKIFDDCDPATFNAPPPAGIGPGTCLQEHGSHHTTLGAFIDELSATQQAADWKFKPSMLKIRKGRPVILENRGGETHTFTQVAAFGGGFVDFLNQLSGNPEPAAECATTATDGSLIPRPPSPVNVFVDADHQASFATSQLKRGRTYMFECCIHPWMRVVLRIR